MSAIAMGGCAGRDLRPAPSAQQLDEDTALATDHEVRVVAEADAWTGPTKVDKAITPFKVTIENRSDRPVRVQLSKLKLTSPEAESYTALPPLKISGTAPVAEPPRGWIARGPDYQAIGFGMAPAYATVYNTELLRHPSVFPYDALYYGTYRDWPAQQLPTPEMIGRALPEGVLEPGGRVQGFVYFQKIPRDVKSVTFSAQFDNADEDTAQRVASVRIPFSFRKR